MSQSFQCSPNWQLHKGTQVAGPVSRAEPLCVFPKGLEAPKDISTRQEGNIHKPHVVQCFGLTISLHS